jgi:antitoxin component YwqK of YwqJK toxin-antitoxin module
MKKCQFIILGILFISFNCFFITACNNNKTVENSTEINDSTKNSINSKDSVPDIIKNDTLVEEFKVMVSDTFDNGSPLKINYGDPQNPNDVKYEKQFYKSGKIFIEGPLVNNKRNGKWIAWYENSVIWSVGYFKDGLKDGASNVYYENGQIRYTKNYEQDVAEGLWEFFDEEGNLLGKVMYENSKILWQEGVPEE